MHEEETGKAFKHNEVMCIDRQTERHTDNMLNDDPGCFNCKLPVEEKQSGGEKI